MYRILWLGLGFRILGFRGCRVDGSEASAPRPKPRQTTAVYPPTSLLPSRRSIERKLAWYAACPANTEP